MARFSLAAHFLAVVFAVMPAHANAKTITHAQCTQQSDNVLRYDCDVETDTAGLAHIEFCEDVSGSGCTPNRNSEFETGSRRNGGCVGPSPCYKYSLTLWNLKADTDYEWQAKAWNSASNDTDGRQYFTTNSLPSPGLYAIEFDITLDPASAQHGTDYYVENVAFNFGCRAKPDPDDQDPFPTWSTCSSLTTRGTLSGTRTPGISRV